MKYIIGMDEAGLAPNLGPLVIVGTIWRTEPPLAADAMHEATAHCITQHKREQDAKLWVADSKLVYRAGEGLAALERVALTGARLTKQYAQTWCELHAQLTADSEAPASDLPPWHHQHNLPLPCENSAESVSQLEEQLRSGLASAGIELVAVSAVTVFPNYFNQLICRTDNKAAAVSELSLRLVRRLLQRCSSHPTEIICDRHGGRARYAALLQQTFPDDWIHIISETELESKYYLGERLRNVSIAFRVGGEACLAVAWAAMTAKYLRELAMRSMNNFWSERVPGLKPTAGYPVDAKRYYAEIATARQTLGLADEILWRSR